MNDEDKQDIALLVAEQIKESNEIEKPKCYHELDADTVRVLKEIAGYYCKSKKTFIALAWGIIVLGMIVIILTGIAEKFAKFFK